MEQKLKDSGIDRLKAITGDHEALEKEVKEVFVLYADGSSKTFDWHQWFLFGDSVLKLAGVEGVEVEFN